MSEYILFEWIVPIAFVLPVQEKHETGSELLVD